MIEIGIATLENVQIIATIFICLYALALPVVYGYVKSDEQFERGEGLVNAKQNTKAVADKFKKLRPYFLVALLITCIPCADHLWKVRLSLIKLELASPENIKASTEHIDRIAQELECKYLSDCPKEKAK